MVINESGHKKEQKTSSTSCNIQYIFYLSNQQFYSPIIEERDFSSQQCTKEFCGVQTNILECEKKLYDLGQSHCTST